MNTKTLTLPLNQTSQPNSKKTFVLLSGIWAVLNTIISTVLTLFMAIFFVWINGKQQKFNKLKDQSS